MAAGSKSWRVAVATYFRGLVSHHASGAIFLLGLASTGATFIPGLEGTLRRFRWPAELCIFLAFVWANFSTLRDVLTKVDMLEAQIVGLRKGLDDQEGRRSALMAMLIDELEHNQHAVISGTPYNVSDVVWKQAHSSRTDLQVTEDVLCRIAALYRDLEFVKSAPRERTRTSMLFGDPTQPARTASLMRVIEALPDITAQLRAGRR